MLSVFLTEEISNKLQASHGQLIYFFCDHQDPRRNSAKSVLRGLLYHIINQGASIPEKVAMRLSDPTHAQKLVSDFAALWSLFESVVDHKPLGPIHCMIDAIDECDEEITELIPKLYGLFTPNESTDEPSFKLIITSRQSPNDVGINPFPHPHLVLKPSTGDSIGDDVDMFITTRVNELASQKEFPSKLTNDVVKAMKTQAEGTFLWAALVIEDLKKKKTIEIREALGSLPKGLPQLYTGMLLQIDESRRQKVAFILRWVVGSVKILSFNELEGILRYKFPYDPCLDAYRTTREYIEICGFFIYEEKGQIRLVHQTVADFLLRGDAKSSSELLPFSFTESEMHTEIADFCLSYLQAGGFKDGAFHINLSKHVWETPVTYSDPSPEISDDLSRIRDFPLLPYAAMIWPQHARKAGQGAIKLLELPAPPITHSQISRVWLETYWVRQFEPAPTCFSLLHLAAFLGLSNLMERLLIRNKLGQPVGMDISVNARDGYARTPLWYAATNGHLEMVQMLLQHGADTESMDYIEPGDRDTPLLKAVKTNQAQVALYLIENGADVHAIDKYRSTPLHESALQRNEVIIRCLLEKGADVRFQDAGGRTPLHSAANDSPRKGCFLHPARNKIEPPEILGIASTDDPLAVEKRIRESAVYIIARHFWLPPNDAPFVYRFLVDSETSGVDSHRREPRQIACKMPPAHEQGTLWIASSPFVKGGEFINKAVVEALLQYKPDVNARNKLTEIALHRAADLVDEGFVDALIKAGSDLELKTKSGTTPMYCTRLDKMSSSGKYQRAVLSKFIAAGANINAVNSKGIPLCHQAMCTARGSVIKFLLQMGADANANVPPTGTTLTHALKLKKKDMAWWLIKAGANLHVQHDGYNPLSLAVEMGSHSIVLLLLEKGMDPREPDDKGIPARLAVKQGHTRIVSIFWKNAADSETRVALLSFAAQEPHDEVLKYILRKHRPDINLKDTQGWTPLQYAACFGSVATNHLLLQHGADASCLLETSREDDMLKLGSTIAHLAAANVQEWGRDVLKFYLQNGANVEARDINGRTPLQLAALMGTHHSFELLVESDVDEEAKDLN